MNKSFEIMETAATKPAAAAHDTDESSSSSSSQQHSLPTSEIVDFYRNKSVFITGATGFLGKVLIEKLLRTCHDLNKIYVLVRSKKGHSAAQRLNEMLNCPLFDMVSQYYPDFRSKLEPIQGDLTEPNLGITEEEEKKLVENVHIVFHSAATVRFDEPLKMAVEMNIIGTKKVIDLAKKMKNLKAFVHVSTAYANCNRQHIGEKVYPAPIQPEKLIEALDWVDEDVVKHLTPKLIQPRPNTYTFTKAIAETLVTQQCKDMPCTIVRPSIVGASWREPFPGWIDNFNGPTALFAAIGKGILRTMLGSSDSTADIIPVDIPVNLMIVSAWIAALKYEQDNSRDIRIYNCTTGQLNRLTWGMVERYSNEALMKNPLENIFIPPNPRFTTNRFIKYFRHFFEEYLPSYIMDLYLRSINKKPLFVKLQSRIKKAVETLEFFTSTQWEFTNDNIFSLMNEMNELDKKLFNIDVKELNWRNYIEQYCLGTKVYLLKEDIAKLSQCRKDLTKKQRLYNLGLKMTSFVLMKYLFFRSISVRKLCLFLFQLALKCAYKFAGLFNMKALAISSS